MPLRPPAPALLVILSAWLVSSCGTVAPNQFPGGSEWAPVQPDQSIVIHHTDIQNLPFVDYDTATGTATVVKDFTTVIAWKDGNFVEMIAYNPRSTGASLMRISTAEKKVVYFTGLCGLGPIDHSQYGNRIVAFTHDDLVMIQGDETAGTYSEVRRAGDGSLVALSQSYHRDFPTPEYIHVR